MCVHQFVQGVQFLSVANEKYVNSQCLWEVKELYLHSEIGHFTRTDERTLGKKYCT